MHCVRSDSKYLIVLFQLDPEKNALDWCTNYEVHIPHCGLCLGASYFLR